MKIQRIYEAGGNPHMNANILAKKLAKKFFYRVRQRKQLHL
jgi:hypothetical protein